MTNSRKAFLSFRERLATEEHRPFAALGKSLFIGVNAFIWIMGLMLGAVPIATNVWNYFTTHILRATSEWFANMGWEGQITLFAINAALTLSVLYVCRNYLKLIYHAAWMKLIDLKIWADLKRIPQNQ